MTNFHRSINRLIASTVGIWLIILGSVGQAAEPIDIGSRRELFVDRHLVEQLDNVQLVLHRPTRREVVFRTDAAWEGNGSAYQSVFQVGDRYRIYYRGGHNPASRAYQTDRKSWETLCVAESADGIHWERPELGIIEFKGSKENNLILDKQMVREVGGSPAHTAVFVDSNPDCPPAERFKIVMYGTKPKGLFLLVSADGYHFQLKSKQPLVTQGAFDSQNLMFWDQHQGVYREYHRSFDGDVRGIMTATSKTLQPFPEPQWIEYPGAAEQALYTNQIQPYYRAPHILVGFPMRYNDRGSAEAVEKLPGLDERQFRAAIHPRYGSAITDSAFMSSRDGVTFHRWEEAFIRPGPSATDTWVYGDNFVFWGMLETKSDLHNAPNEISLYATEGYWQGDATSFRRYTMRMDGFVSAQAPYRGGQLVTRPVTFAGAELTINFATSAAGGVRIGIQNADGSPVPNFGLNDCDIQIGDEINRVVSWNKNTNVSQLAGKPIRLVFELKDADIYSFQFVAK